jgi:hypothetical protein
MVKSPKSVYGGSMMVYKFCGAIDHMELYKDIINSLLKETYARLLPPIFSSNGQHKGISKL